MIPPNASRPVTGLGISPSLVNGAKLANKNNNSTKYGSQRRVAQLFAFRPSNHFFDNRKTTIVPPIVPTNNIKHVKILIVPTSMFVSLANRYTFNISSKGIQNMRAYRKLTRFNLRKYVIIPPDSIPDKK